MGHLGRIESGGLSGRHDVRLSGPPPRVKAGRTDWPLPRRPVRGGAFSVLLATASDGSRPPDGLPQASGNTSCRGTETPPGSSSSVRDVVVILWIRFQWERSRNSRVKAGSGRV